MISCRYVGESSMIGDREYDTVGQRATLSEQGYREAVLGGAAFIPEDMFNKLGFTSVELDKFGQAGMRIDPPKSFCEKLARAQQLFLDIRTRMVDGRTVQRALAELSDAELVGSE